MPPLEIGASIWKGGGNVQEMGKRKTAKKVHALKLTIPLSSCSAKVSDAVFAAIGKGQRKFGHHI